MESNHIDYDHKVSFSRIKEVLDASDNSFEELDHIPARSRLTYTNGFYVKCSALFVDIRDSSSLPSKYKRPKLAKLYRSYLSEVVAVMNGSSLCSDIVINGDCVSGIFNTPKKKDLDSVFSVSAQVSSVIKFLNHHYSKNGIDPIKVGIGLSWGRALMIKSGYKGSGLNDVVWMGDVVNEASNLCGYGNKEYSDEQTMVSEVYHGNLNDHNKGLLSYNHSRSCYHGDIISKSMDGYCKEKCK